MMLWKVWGVPPCLRALFNNGVQRMEPPSFSRLESTVLASSSFSSRRLMLELPRRMFACCSRAAYDYCRRREPSGLFRFGEWSALNQACKASFPVRRGGRTCSSRRVLERQGVYVCKFCRIDHIYLSHTQLLEWSFSSSSQHLYPSRVNSQG